MATSIPLASKDDLAELQNTVTALIENASGVPGPPGTPGAQWLHGNGVPSDGAGSDGWWYVRDDSPKSIYSKAAGHWSFVVSIEPAQGLPGDAGPSGPGVLSGTTQPTVDTGAPGWFYFQKTATDLILYGPKASDNTWPTGTSLVAHGSGGTGLSTVDQLIEWTASGSYQFTSYTYDATYTDLPDSGAIVWPDGSTGTYTTTAFDTTWGEVRGYTVSHAASGNVVTQPNVSRDNQGRLSDVPPLQVSGPAAGGLYEANYSDTY